MAPRSRFFSASPGQVCVSPSLSEVRLGYIKGTGQSTYIERVPILRVRSSEKSLRNGWNSSSDGWSIDQSDGVRTRQISRLMQENSIDQLTRIDQNRAVAVFRRGTNSCWKSSGWRRAPAVHMELGAWRTQTFAKAHRGGCPRVGDWRRLRNGGVRKGRRLTVAEVPPGS